MFPKAVTCVALVLLVLVGSVFAAPTWNGESPERVYEPDFQVDNLQSVLQLFWLGPTIACTAFGDYLDDHPDIDCTYQVDPVFETDCQLWCDDKTDAGAECDDMWDCSITQYCSGEKCVERVCSDGYEVSNHVCVKEFETTTCVDTDGRDTTVAGVVTLSGGTSLNKRDYCIDSKTVKEFFCTSTFYDSFNYGCAGSCNLGKCSDTPITDCNLLGGKDYCNSIGFQNCGADSGECKIFVGVVDDLWELCTDLSCVKGTCASAGKTILATALGGGKFTDEAKCLVEADILRVEGCTPGETRCGNNLRLVQECSSDGQWADMVLCPEGEGCSAGVCVDECIVMDTCGDTPTPTPVTDCVSAGGNCHVGWCIPFLENNVEGSCSFGSSCCVAAGTTPVPPPTPVPDDKFPSFEGGLDELEDASKTSILQSLCFVDEQCESGLCKHSRKVSDVLEEILPESQILGLAGTSDSSLGRLINVQGKPVMTFSLLTATAIDEVDGICISEEDDTSSLEAGLEQIGNWLGVKGENAKLAGIGAIMGVFFIIILIASMGGKKK